jgi:hypothetical protein
MLVGYIDPGAGNTILQLIITGGVSLGYAIKIYWRTILNFLRS